jgi:group I intron endonuclease
MICNIYIIRNSINNKIYVGQTWQNLEDRWKVHLNPNGHCCFKLFNAMNKYGRENFKIEKITEAYSQLEADVLEIHFIAKFNSIQNGYNIKEGGSHGKHSEETKKKISKGGKGLKRSKETCEKIRQANLGKTFSDETKKRASISHSGKFPSELTRQKMSDAKLGNKFSLGNKLSKETRAKMSKARLGNKNACKKQ